MASLSEHVETFEDVLKKVEGFTCEGLINADRVKYIVSDMARRFKDAHDRDIAELVECLNEAVGDKMSADEIRMLADSNAIHRPKCRTSEKFPRCREWCPSEDCKKCKEADEVRAVLLSFAAMVSKWTSVLEKHKEIMK